MSETLERYVRVADGFERRLQAVKQSEWEQASPCEGWTAFDVAAHVISTHLRMLSMLAERDTSPPAKPEEVAALWKSVSDELKAALADPAVASQVMPSMFGEQAFESLVGQMLCCDTTIHTWDLARAIGADESLDAVEVSLGHTMLAGLGDGIRRPGGFDNIVEPSSEAPADAQTAFLRFAGRNP